MGSCVLRWSEASGGGEVAPGPFIPIAGSNGRLNMVIIFV